MSEKVLAGQTTFSELIRAAVPLSEFISRREILSAVIKNYARSMEAAKTFGKETVAPVSKYITTAEKLPAEMEVIVLG